MLLDDLVREVQRKIGRNIILFQQLECLLKTIVANGQFSGFLSELKSNIATRSYVVNKQTMGQLVGQFVESSNPERNDISIEPDELKEPYISFDFRVETGADVYKEKKESLSRLVSERNELVHHLLSSLDFNSLKSCKRVEIHLDEQADKIRAEINSVQSTAKALVDGRKQIANYLCSDEGQKELLLSFLRLDRLVVLLAEIARKGARGDGWTLMNTAGQLVR